MVLGSHGDPEYIHPLEDEISLGANGGTAKHRSACCTGTGLYVCARVCVWWVVGGIYSVAGLAVREISRMKPFFHFLAAL